jgi:hypothetical protein
MAFRRWRRRPKPRALTFAIRITFADGESEQRLWKALQSAPDNRNRNETRAKLDSTLFRTSWQSFLNPEHVRVTYRQGSVLALVTLEGLRLGYELFSEYDDFTNSAKLLLHQLEDVTEEVLDNEGFGPVSTSGTILGLPRQRAEGRSLSHTAMMLLLVTQIGMFAVGGLAVSQIGSDPERVSPLLQHVVYRTSWGIGILTAAVLLLLILFEWLARE